ncbi:DUF1877 family protein [Flammeovirgaceae bacterium KN852]|uniref:DUF1877 family protein n=1 Tax=Marinigracilibium pacificum TaxID=2729599 RepID=A0A848J341_9BACT|nr:DUF1877 family protein [Marinigracilibium pacificum]
MAELTNVQLRENFNLKDMNSQGVYSGPFDESALDYLLENFQKIKDFYINAARSNNAVVTYLS